LQTLAQLIPAFALVGIAAKKVITTFGLFLKLPAKKISPLSDSVVLKRQASEFSHEEHCGCDKEAVQ
jgi:hypothetical protein